MKQNKDREEFDKLADDLYESGLVDGDENGEPYMNYYNSADKLWSWIETHTQKKVEEKIERVKGLRIGTWKEWISATKQYGGTKEEWERMQKRNYDRAISDVLNIMEEK